MNAALGFLLGKGWQWFLPALTWVVLWSMTPFGKLWKNPTDCERTIHILQQGSWRAT